MATQRYVSTSFWDDPWITTLAPLERYTYLYLLTNPLTNIAGVYQISMKRMCFDTGLDEKKIRSVLKVFADNKKAFYYNDLYIVLPKWPKHQKWHDHKKIEAGIIAVLKNLSPEVLGFLVSIGYTYPIDSLSIAYIYPSNYSDSDSDLNSDTDTDTDLIKATPAEPLQAEPELYAMIKTRFEEKQPVRVLKNGERKPGFDNYGKEGKAIKQLIEKARARSPDDPGGFLEAMIRIFENLRLTDRFYRGQPFLPSALNASGIWDRVLNEAAERWEDEKAAQEFDAEGVVF